MEAVSPETSGWNDVPRSAPLLDGDDAVRRRGAASVSTRGPTSVTSGARMKVACTGAPPKPSTVELGLERVDLAAEGVALHDDVEAAEGLLPVDARR